MAGCGISFLVTIGGIFATIVSAMILHYTGTWNLVDHAIKWIQKIFDWFIATIPNPAKVLIFIFLIVAIFNFGINGFMGIKYQCTSQSELREMDSFFAGVGYAFQCALNIDENITDAEFDAFVLNHTEPSAFIISTASPEDMMRIECIGEPPDDVNPRLTFFGIDFLNFRIWILLIILGAMIIAYNKYKD